MTNPPGRSLSSRLRRVATALVAVALLILPLGQSTASPSPVTFASASAGAAVQRVPAACARNGNYVWSHLVACGWPGPGNTGPRLTRCAHDRLVKRGTTPTAVIHVRRAGAVIACQDITGCLSIEAPNVTVRDVRVTCTSGRTGEAANGSGAIKVQTGASAAIQRVRVDGMRGVHSCVWHMGTRLSVTRLNCLRVNDGIFSWGTSGDPSSAGNHFTIAESYFHGFTTRTANGHVDGYQTEGASYGRIHHNTYLMTSDSGNDSNSAIAIWNGNKSSHDITVSNNLISGGGFAVYAEDYSPSEANPAGGYSVTNVRFTGNVFSKHLYGCVGFWGVWYPRGRPSDGWRRSGNTVLETAANIDHRNPSSNGHVCS